MPHTPPAATPPPANPRIPFVTVTNWVRAARLCGIDIEAIFREEGIDTQLLHPETATLDRAAFQRLMHRCVAETRQAGSPQHFPLVLGESFAFEYLSDVETFITTSATLRDATRALEWIPPLVNPFMRFSLSEHGPDARIGVRFEGVDANHDIGWPFTEAVFATVIKFSRVLLGGQPLIGRVTMRHPAHQNAATVASHFQVPVEWGADLDALWFERRLLDQPLRGAFPSLHEQAAQRVVQQVAQRALNIQASGDPSEQGHHLITQVERAFLDKPRLMGLGLEALAEELGLHARTLQRRLKDAGDSHSGIQARVRHRLALAWLQQPELSIEDISERLGFTDRRSFTLAFTRWSGQTPSQFRRASR
ncbi:MAG: AraC family transcriptional regulator ligand-binding domain-containing protein [Burkholderiales bacterium]|nr:AraC family transcriptional regulator ligand-binding domain-containing protein [Burkholderiales bacterium]MBH2017598.1 AraC family transcriptional regulator ligand-binding domain-containing protein [Burkholderiales bacterium]